MTRSSRSTALIRTLLEDVLPENGAPSPTAICALVKAGCNIVDRSGKLEIEFSLGQLFDACLIINQELYVEPAKTDSWSLDSRDFSERLANPWPSRWFENGRTCKPCPGNHNLPAHLKKYVLTLANPGTDHGITTDGRCPPARRPTPGC